MKRRDLDLEAIAGISPSVLRERATLARVAREHSARAGKATNNGVRISQAQAEKLAGVLEWMPKLEAALRELLESTRDWFDPDAPETEPPKIVRVEAAWTRAKGLLAELENFER